MNRTLSVLRDYSGKIFNFCVRERNLEGERLRANSSYCGFAIAAESKAWLLGGRGRGRLPGEAVMCWRLEKPVFFFYFFFSNKTGLLFEDGEGKHGDIFPL